MASTETDPLMPRRTLVHRLVRMIASPYYRYRHAKLLHSVRVGLAMLVSILATSGIDIPHGIWASVTLLVVIGGLQHHGNIRKKATERAAGTLLGALIGLSLIVLQNVTGSLPVTYVAMSAIAAVCAWFAIGPAGYVALLTAITMCIVAGHGDNLIDTGLWRTLNVLIGIVIALAFSFVFPLHATYSWRYRMADNLRDCARIYMRLVKGIPLTGDEQVKAFTQMSARLVQMRSLMPSVAKEVDVPVAQLEAIQRLHRAVLSSLELLATGTLLHANPAARAAFALQCGAEVRDTRGMLLEMARALRFGNLAAVQLARPALKGAESAGQEATACASADAPSRDDAPASTDACEGLARHLPDELQGPFWLGQRLTEQIEGLRDALFAIEPNWNIEKRMRAGIVMR